MGKKYHIAPQIQALTLFSTSITIEYIRRITGYSQIALFDLKKKTKKRGYDPFVYPIIYNIHVENVFKNGRPSISLEKLSKIITKVTIDCHRQKKSTAEIARKVKISQYIVVAWVLKKSGYKKVKFT